MREISHIGQEAGAAGGESGPQPHDSNCTLTVWPGTGELYLCVCIHSMQHDPRHLPECATPEAKLSGPQTAPSLSKPLSACLQPGTSDGTSTATSCCWRKGDWTEHAKLCPESLAHSHDPEANVLHQVIGGVVMPPPMASKKAVKAD